MVSLAAEEVERKGERHGENEEDGINVTSEHIEYINITRLSW